MSPLLSISTCLGAPGAAFYLHFWLLWRLRGSILYAFSLAPAPLGSILYRFLRASAPLVQHGLCIFTFSSAPRAAASMHLGAPVATPLMYLCLLRHSWGSILDAFFIALVHLGRHLLCDFSCSLRRPWGSILCVRLCCSGATEAATSIPSRQTPIRLRGASSDSGGSYDS